MIDEITALSASSNGLLKSTSETRYVNHGAELGGLGVNEAANVGDVSFSDAMANVSADAISRVKEGEAAALAGVDGKASVQQVVEAVMAAEASLRTAVAVRDKVVAAYQEISRMTI
ncbi:flagellar hook-basal body complex protein FliE [Roseibium sp. RKSG952]|uniref:flagellar hook-basal body complex protein FliE n=1 Tax=Roseibium sp. RKSG952 TaxID=2529384 RepID=UPI0012BC0387|nr:flagellar hook-basal body complex protein FliE [Roseibium sp. RKSG952]MTH96614.1 flagellar hook-basal body protein FliE [Roseibium sp. RKSG952]